MHYDYANSLHSRETAIPMSVDADTPVKVSAEPAGQSVAALGFLDLSEEALDALIGRIEQARTHALALSPDDYQLLLSAVMTLASMQEQLSHDDLTIRKFRKMLGIVRSSEKLKDLLPADGAGDEQKDNADDKPVNGSDNSSDPTPAKKRPRKRKDRKTPPRTPPTVLHHPITDLCKGDHCPGCHAGKVYKYVPGQLLRISGHSPYSATRHVSERLRCNGCQQIFSAELPAEVLADGGPDQHYGYSARTLMAIRRCFAGDPYFRQQSVQALLGEPITASTIFDQCEKVADALNPVFRAIKLASAQASLFYFDDTPNRILQQEPVEKSRGGKTRLRTGIYSSACLAILSELADESLSLELMSPTRRIVLFQTNVGHAGEWMEEILAGRATTLGPPILMSDALSSNQVHNIAFINALCNAHGRRGFAELIELSPRQARFALERYQHIWANDAHCTDHQYTDEQRRDYHFEHSLIHLQTLYAWCDQQLNSEETEANSNLGKAMRYFKRHFAGLSEFCYTPGVPLDNNECERMIKLIVRSRKNSLFHQTAIGAEISDVISSVLATCHENNINAFAYLNAVQSNHKAVRASPNDWLPWNYPGSP